MALWDKVKKAGGKIAEGGKEAFDEIKGDPEYTIEELKETTRLAGVCPVCNKIHTPMDEV